MSAVCSAFAKATELSDRTFSAAARLTGAATLALMSEHRLAIGKLGGVFLLELFGGQTLRVLLFSHCDLTFHSVFNRRRARAAVSWTGRS
jgi:hypothetical protein